MILSQFSSVKYFFEIYVVDILTNLHLDKLLAFHQQHKPLISFAVTNRKTARNFLFDEENRLVYRGRLDDSWKDAQAVTSEELKASIEALLENKKPSAQQRPSMGCSIKWKPEI